MKLQIRNKKIIIPFTFQSSGSNYIIMLNYLFQLVNLPQILSESNLFPHAQPDDDQKDVSESRQYLQH